jgi:HSP20 family protein
MVSSEQVPAFAPSLVMRRVVRDMDPEPGRASAIETLSYSLGECPWVPDLEVFVEHGRLEIHVDLPGLKGDEVLATVTDGRVNVEGERRYDDTRTYWHVPERTYGRFHRTVRLPAGADAGRTTMAFKNGVLQVSVPLRRTGYAAHAA